MTASGSRIAPCQTDLNCYRNAGHDGEHMYADGRKPDPVLSLRFDGPVEIAQSDTDPGDMGEPRMFESDGVTYVTVPSFALWKTDYMCPNCVTPWKCNGPHIPEAPR